MMMVEIVENYYDGFRTFSWLADFVGLPIDQVNFLFTQFTAIVLAGILRVFLSPNKVTSTVRHAFSLVFGVALGYFCFGRQAVHLVGLPTICYVVMRTQNPRIIQKIVLATALIYLSCIHLHRQIYDYGSYTLDITGPLMVITQKVTTLAFSVHDGLTRCEEDLTPIQRQQIVKRIPTALEYFSYVFQFQTLMAGPILFYSDYIDFIYGRHCTKSLTGNQDKNSGKSNEIILEPSPGLVVIKKVIMSLICAIIFTTLITVFPIQRLKEDEFLTNTSMLYKIWYMNCATMVARFKYYHAWLFADAICNNAGIGFNGYDENGKARWNLVSNVNIIEFETALSFKDSIDNWNMGTNRWLRSVVYERAGRQKLLYTYALSALWHGFYPGYYLTFTTGAIFTMAARTVRRCIRPYFLGSKEKKFLYDALTFLATRITMAYATFSFVLLEFIPSIKVYLYMYFIPHWLAVFTIFILPRLPIFSSRKKNSGKDSIQSQDISNGNMHKIK